MKTTLAVLTAFATLVAASQLIVRPVSAGDIVCTTETRTVTYDQCDEILDDYGYPTGDYDCYQVSYEEEEEVCGYSSEPDLDRGPLIEEDDGRGDYDSVYGGTSGPDDYSDDFGGDD